MNRDELLYFDAYTQIGPRSHKHPAAAWKLSELIDEMAHCSISAAMVSSTMSINYDAMHGNLALSKMLQPHDNLFPLWNVMPSHSKECPEPNELAQLMKSHGVHAVKIAPASNGWLWESAESQLLFEMLAREKRLLVLPRAEFGDFAALDRFLETYPQLPTLVVSANWLDQRTVYPLLRKHRHLHISLDHFQVHNGIEELVREGLEDQLLYASHAVDMSMGAHRCYIDLADISQDAKEKIASGNLIRLLRVDTPRLQSNAQEDGIMSAVRKGQPVPVPMIDMHMHILDEGLNGGGCRTRMYRGGPRGVFALLTRMGCVGGGFMSWNGTMGCDVASGNQCVTAALDAAPTGYWGLPTFDPTHYTQAEMKQQIHEVYADTRMIGMKPYVRFGVEYDDPAYAAWWEFGNEHHFYAGIHRVRSDFREVDVLAQKYPNVRWVVYHCGSDFGTADLAIECIRKHSNVYAEITLTPVPMGMIDYLVAHAGEDRVVYGSDLPMRDPRQQLGWVVFSHLTMRAKQKVLAGNAMRIIEPCLKCLPAYNQPQAARTTV